MAVRHLPERAAQQSRRCLGHTERTRTSPTFHVRQGPTHASPQDYFVLLDQHCEDFKAAPGGGVGWFAHIYSDYMEPGYGIYNTSGRRKFTFNPRTHC